MSQVRSSGILSPHAQDAPGCKGLSPWVEVGGVGAVVEGAGLLTICTMSGATLISVMSRPTGRIAPFRSSGASASSMRGAPCQCRRRLCDGEYVEPSRRRLWCPT